MVGLELSRIAMVGIAGEFPTILGWLLSGWSR
jgi:hypothetical protein